MDSSGLSFSNSQLILYLGTKGLSGWGRRREETVFQCLRDVIPLRSQKRVHRRRERMLLERGDSQLGCHGEGWPGEQVVPGEDALRGEARCP